MREKYLNFMCTLNYFLLLRKSIVGLQETILKKTFASVKFVAVICCSQNPNEVFGSTQEKEN